ncbi:hypothetical protein [Rhizobium leguminosarum]|nr:hypothetical protein [Rhizobium leguminosarum]MBY5345748.1 hypothetical protein [Rhizobium leguminosarum]
MINAAEILGVRGVLVHAISDGARAFNEVVASCLPRLTLTKDLEAAYFER